jgi:hypothetical protein
MPTYPSPIHKMFDLPADLSASEFVSATGKPTKWCAACRQYHTDKRAEHQGKVVPDERPARSAFLPSASGWNGTTGRSGTRNILTAVSGRWRGITRSNRGGWSMWCGLERWD